MSRFIGIFALGLLLSGCQSIAEMRAQEDAQDNETCLGYGAKRGSDAYVRCRTDLRHDRRVDFSPVVVAPDPFLFGGFGPGFCRRTPFGVRCY